MLVWGGYWYLRDLILTGTPLYPKGLARATDLWGEMRPASWNSSLLGSGRPQVWDMALDCVAKMTGPCHLAAVLLLPLSVVWLLTSGLWFRGGRQAEGRIRIGLALLIVAAGLVLAATPNTVELRPGTLDMLLRRDSADSLWPVLFEPGHPWSCRSA